MHIRPDIPVILCTGHSDQVTQEMARDVGNQGICHEADDYPDTGRNRAQRAGQPAVVMCCLPVFI